MNKSDLGFLSLDILAFSCFSYLASVVEIAPCEVSECSLG